MTEPTMSDTILLTFIMGILMGWLVRSLYLIVEMRRAARKLDLIIQQMNQNARDVESLVQNEDIQSISVRLKHYVLNGQHYFYLLDPQTGEEEFACQGQTLEEAAVRCVERYGSKVSAAWRHESTGQNYVFEAGTVRSE